MNVEEGIWTSILESTSSSKKRTRSKKVIVLGDSQSGKTSLAAGLGLHATSPEKADLGLTYGYLDVKDKLGEDLLARIGLYQLPTPNVPLLKLALTPDTLLDSLILILLDWEQPWNFPTRLHAWISALHTTIASISSTDPRAFALAQERLDLFWKSYQEPIVKEDGSVGPTSSTNRDMTDLELLPLPSGTLLENLGIPICFVCTKSDVIDSLEKEKSLSEEQIDYVQQLLRTVGLYYGASLFFISKQHSDSIIRLKDYLLHRLYHVPSVKATSTHTNPTSSQREVSSGSLRPFPFNYRAIIADRNSIMIPSGWDSLGKIRILRDTFQPEQTSEAWAVYIKSSPVSDQAESLGELWQRTVPDRTQYKHLVNPSSLIKAQDEQDFLAAQYQLLQKEQVKDPRSHFQSRTTFSPTTTPQTATSDLALLAAAGPSLVGPMSSSSLGVSGALGTRADASSESPTIAQGPLSPPLPSTPRNTLSSPTSYTGQTNGAAPASGGTQQNEVLANFFQSLLSARKDPNAARGALNNRPQSDASAGKESKAG